MTNIELIRLGSESEVTQSCPTLCDPVDCSLPSSFVHGISQARILEWIAIAFSRGSSWPRDPTQASCIGKWILYHCTTRKAPTWPAAAAAKLLQSCLTLCDPIDGSPPGSPVPGILQARTLEWIAISFSNALKWKVKVKSLSHVLLFKTPPLRNLGRLILLCIMESRIGPRGVRLQSSL